MQQKNRKNISKVIFITIIAVNVLLIACNIFFIIKNSHIKKTVELPHTLKIFEEELTHKYDKNYAMLAQSIQDYIDSVAPGSALHGSVVAKVCIYENIDPCFILAQGQKESHFGTMGMARKTNSVWNVMAYDGHQYDDIKSAGKYKCPDYSITPYIELLKNEYLVDKTEYDLLDTFVNNKGKRYATSKDYEVHLRSLYRYIKNNTDIYKYFESTCKYKILLNN